MTLRSLVNGEDTTSIGIEDRGLQYGDGLFETLAVVEGRIRRLERHLARLGRGCKRLGITPPSTTDVRAELARLARQSERAVLKLIVTRGPGERGYAPPATAAPNRIATRHPWPRHVEEWCEHGIAVRLCALRLSDQPVLAGLKHCNRLEQVMARREWSDPQIAEGLLLDARDALVCGTMTNVFIVRQGKLLTPLIDRCGVAGTVRETLLGEASATGIAVEERTLDVQDLAAADEVFVTNAILGVCPVTSLQGEGGSDSTWRIGPVTRSLQRLVG
jgi:4-amino-4-deoxychorismate lyase